MEVRVSASQSFRLTLPLFGFQVASNTGFMVFAMKAIAEIPSSPKEAMQKVSLGLRELGSFVWKSPCRAICFVLNSASVALARFMTVRKRIAKAVAIWAFQNLAWVALVEVFRVMLDS